MSEKIHLVIDGREVASDASASIIQAYTQSGAALTANVGCMGQGVCGSCRCLVRREGEREVKTALACETRVEPGMQVSFIDHFAPAHVHHYDLLQVGDGWGWLDDVARIFPEAAHCRHCSGCDRACPKGLQVQHGVADAVAGDFASAAEKFDECVMCNMCTLACPESIRPNHLGLFARRVRAARTLRPADLLRRLHEIESGQMQVVIDEPAQVEGGQA